MKNLKDLTVMTEETTPTVRNETATVMSIIKHAATSENVDVEKMERLIAMQKDIRKEEAIASFNNALVQVIAKIPAIEKASKAHNTTYAKLEDISKKVKPVLNEHGMALTYRISYKEKEVIVTAVLSHKDGHSESTDFSAPIDTSGSKSAIQARGSSVTYGKRYAMCALLDITTFESDNNGFFEDGVARKVTEAQAMALVRALGGNQERIKKCCAHYGVESLEELPQAMFADALATAKRK